MAKKHTFWLVACLLIFHIAAPAEDTSAPVNARQVMLKFAESQKKLNSYIIKSNSTSTYVYTGIPPYNGRGTIYHDSDVRFDGDCVKESVTTWGDVGNRDRNVPKENAFYQSVLWDGKTGYELSLVPKNQRQTAKHPGLRCTRSPLEPGHRGRSISKRERKRLLRDCELRLRPSKMSIAQWQFYDDRSR